MTSVVDVWRAVDPEARLVSGTAAQLSRPVRGIMRSRAMAPHLPDPADGALLLLDAAAVRIHAIPELLGLLADARLAPVAVIITDPPRGLEPADEPMPVLVSERPLLRLAAEATAYLADEPASLARLATDLRLACAEAALGDPQLATPAGLIAARIDRGVAIAVDGQLATLHPRAAGRAVAARFAALHAGLLATTAAGGRREHLRRSRDGLWLAEGRIRPGASAWLFDDLPLAAVDEVAIGALTVTARALLRRPAAPPTAPRRAAAVRVPPPSARDPLDATLLAVARANGRVAPAARELGVHRNTVLYRLRRAMAERGIDPRRPQDALRILAEAQPAAGGEERAPH
jgi:hypothetical protein